ncbi:MAG: phosphotransferase family protein [Thermoleophilia bacterium]|nr:phosphotransferase family protein [Thermoleophilia bacterium]
MTAPPGIDVASVTDWLTGRLPDLRPPLTFTRIGDGQSNLTFRVDDAAGRRFVLRRPPLGEILASAHDVVREHRILTALHPTGFPVPRTIGVCEDPAVTGASFYAMEHVDGHVLGRLAEAERLGVEVRAEAARQIAATLAQLHAIDLDAVGLGDLRRPESLISRQLRRWRRQWEASKTRELADVDEVAVWLEARMPEERESVLLHGDYHLHNFVLGGDGRLRAVLDWELCTAGDPLADVGQMVAYWNELRSADGFFREPVAAAEGFPDAAALVDLYAAAAARDVAALGYWVAFAYWKIAIIVEGVYRRWLNDPQNGSDAGSLAPAVVRLAALARDTAAAGAGKI